MSVALNVFTIAAVSFGAFFFLAGTVGLLRFPDTLTRLHALTKADNLGLGLIMRGITLALLVAGIGIAAIIAGGVWRTGDALTYLSGGWAPPLGIKLRADGLSAAMIVVTSIVILATGLCAPHEFCVPRGTPETRASLCFWILLLSVWAAMNAVFLGNDFFNLYVALELVTFAGVPLVCLSGSPATLTAALRYLLFALIGSALYLLGAVLLYGSYGTLDIGLLIAYSTVAQIGYLFLIFPLAAEPNALAGGMFQAISHAFAKAAMFMAAGLMAGVLGHDRIADLRGIGRALPVTVFAFGLAALSLVGVPPSGGFFTKCLLLSASNDAGQWWWATVILAGGLLAGGYMFRALVPALAAPSQYVILSLLITGFGMKIALLPMHFWMPLSYTASPIPAAAVLSGAAVKAGVIGLIRFLPFGMALPGWGGLLTIVGLCGAFYGVGVGVTQNNPKTVLAYSSVSQMGFLVAVLGMGLSVGDASVAPLAAFYAANHVLVKGALFLAVGVAALTASQRIGIAVVPGVVVALGLAGLPLTGGALAKLAVKDPLGYGAAGTLATLSASGTTLLMLHFLHRLVLTAGRDPAEAAAARLVAPWLAMAVASVAVPWILYPFAGIGSLSNALGPAALWKVLWPILLGGVLAVGLRRWGHRLPRIPEGDVVAASGVAARAAAASGAALERADSLLRQWAIASLLLLMVAILLATAMLAGS
jgi:formate hydrogenlyase subunit 3/multisubunit Na+/H+ antiporter MnhD subunit